MISNQEKLLHILKKINHHYINWKIDQDLDSTLSSMAEVYHAIVLEMYSYTVYKDHIQHL